MNKDLRDFLEASELDRLVELKEELQSPAEEDQQVIIQLLHNGTECQSIANLLMHPQLIPKMERCQAFLRGLRETEHIYLVLAAFVGLQDLLSEDFSIHLGKEIIKEVIRVLHHYRGVIAERASIFLADRLWHIDFTIVPDIIGLVDHTSEIVQHNTLVALIPMVGLNNIRRVLTEEVKAGRLSAQAKIETEKKLSEISGFNEDNSVDESEFDLGMLGTPLLAYIPNFDEWQNDLAR